jgi:hypothetical protein
MVNLANPSGASVGTPASVTVTINGSGATDTGTLALSAASDTAAQTAGSITITVSRSGGSSGAASVAYATQNGTAVSGANYTAKSGTLNWAAGDAADKTFSVPLSATSFTGSKTFNVSLSSASGAALGSPATATVTINGSGAAATPGIIAFASNSAAAAQSAGSVSIIVSRSGGSSGAASVAYATQNGTATAGTHYTAANGTLNWAAGDAANKSFAVTLSANAFSGSKAFSVVLSGVTGAALGNVTTATVTISGSATAGTNSPAAALAAKLGKPSRLLVGLGSQSVATVQSQGLQIDMYDQYLVGNWPTWNSPPCDYVCVVAGNADSLGAVPFFTVYMMADNGDGNLAGLSDSTFMASYWSRLKLLYQDIATFGKPALVHLEPDFWGYVERQATNSDPTKMAALVSSNADCAALPNNVAGVAGCMIAMARKYAPKAYVGLSPSAWGGDSDAQVVAFMNALGAQNADMIVEQTWDRDAGCFEISPQPSDCARGGSGYYWDESNTTHPNFQDHLVQVQAYHAGIGNLPVIWWQTPMGVPSSTPGGSVGHYRDNKVHYFLTHPAELTAVGGLGVVFGAGDGNQTVPTTDGGQFQNLSGQYRANPAPLP